MRATDDGIWHEVPETAYRAFLQDHPRRASLKAFHDTASGREWWFIYDAEAYAADPAHVRSEARHKVAWRTSVDGVMRFWIPATAVA